MTPFSINPIFLALVWQDYVIFCLIAIIISMIGYFFLVLKKKKKVVEHLAFKDHRGLSNMNDFNHRSERILKRPHESLAVMSLTISHFEQLENVLGNRVGSGLVLELSKILNNSLTGDDLLAHGDGSDFYILKQYQTKDELVTYTSTINDSVRDLARDLNVKVDLFVLFGIYTIPQNETEMEPMISKATYARTSLQDQTLHSYIFYDSDLQTISSSIEEDIHNAIKNHEFNVYYQPVFNTSSGRLVAAEALVRWNHPKKGIIAPFAFIPIMEKKGSIIEIGNFVVDQLCSDLEDWRKRGKRLIPLSFNLSSVELYRADITHFITDTLERHKINPILVSIEITESAASKDMTFSKSVLNQLRELSFRILMDDFGTGYSSLSYLKTFPIDAIKLDRSFFFDIEINAKSREIVQTIIKLAAALDIEVVAEGVETIAQVTILKELGCKLMQGYYYSKPLSKADFETFVASNPFEIKGKAKEGKK